MRVVAHVGCDDVESEWDEVDDPLGADLDGLGDGEGGAEVLGQQDRRAEVGLVRAGVLADRGHHGGAVGAVAVTVVGRD